MNPKFGLREMVYHKGEGFIVTACAWDSCVGGWRYDITDQYGWFRRNVFEEDLLSESEWQMQRGNQNAVGMGAWQTNNIEVKIVSGGPTCVCGAHKVKDSRHSSWCEVKN